MATFDGTPEEFRRFIDPWLRNRIQAKTKAAKRQQGKCADCGRADVHLDAAHLTGRDRGVVVSEVLRRLRMSKERGKRVQVDLGAFEKAVLEAHHPVDKAFRFICRECHRKYDAKQAAGAARQA